MTKRALCIGINDYPVRGADLRGCVNDARAWAGLLIDHYDFDADNVTLLLDEQATKRRILGEIDDLIGESRRGDSLVITNSSHGTYVADVDGDESRYDEALCPYDMKERLIVDDELRERFATLPSGVRLTVVSDSCHSGSVTRAANFLDTPDDRRRRFVSPTMLNRSAIDAVRRRASSTRRSKYPQSKMREVLLAGCRDNQYSYDARFGDTYHGAMTYFALQIIEEEHYRISFDRLLDELVVRLDEAGYDQEPQVEGKSRNRRRAVFS